MALLAWNFALKSTQNTKSQSQIDVLQVISYAEVLRQRAISQTAAVLAGTAHL